MENYGRCKDCEYGEPTDCSWKWSCTWYHTLENPDELKDCNHYRTRLNNLLQKGLSLNDFQSLSDSLFYYIIRYLRIISWSSSTFSTTVP